MFLFVLLATSLLLASISAFFSIFGISHLYSGSQLAVIIMASGLEIGKLVNFSYLYRYWKDTTVILKSYLIAAGIVLMGITSLGTYAFLTSAYAKVAAVPQVTINQVSANEARITSLSSALSDNRTQLQALQSSINRNQTTLDTVIGKLTYGNNTTTHNLQRQIDYYNTQSTNLQSLIVKETNERDSLLSLNATLNSSLTSNDKIGPFIYVAKIFNTSVDQIVKIFTIFLVVVFDPLAVSLLLAWNSATKKKNGEINRVIDKWKNGETPAKIPEQVVEKKEEAPEPKREHRHSKPLNYYQEVGYDWEKDHRWKSDPQAIEYRKNLP